MSKKNAGYEGTTLSDQPASVVYATLLAQLCQANGESMIYLDQEERDALVREHLREHPDLVVIGWDSEAQRKSGGE